MADLPPFPLPAGVESSYVDCSSTTGLTLHILTSGTNNQSCPLLLFCHGFPELAYSWRHILPYFGARGFYAVAFDQRGYGRTTGWDTRSYENLDIHSFGAVQNVVDVLALVSRLGRNQVDVIIGHDFGAVTAASCALMRPDFFRACVIMSHPFDGVPALQGSKEQELANKIAMQGKTDPDIGKSLALMGRKHYKWSNSTAAAVDEWNYPKQGLTDFLHGYFYLKSASDSRNEPFALQSWTASELAKMPHYYIQKLDLSMAETVAEDVQGQDLGDTKSWLSDEELEVYVAEWTRTGFLGALSWYRNRTMPGASHQMMLFAGKQIEVPLVFISGKQDWGNYQKPGAFEGLSKASTDFRGIYFIDGAGHWPQQERPQDVIREIDKFISLLSIK